MSATGRGAERAALDDYSTPAEAIDPILDVLLPRLTCDDHILEPAAGAGAIVGRLISHGIEPERIRAYELEAGRARRCRRLCKTWTGDFLDSAGKRAPPDAAYKLVITNPPYTHALAFAQRGLQWLHDGGHLALLLRLNWLEGVRTNPRYAFLRETRPTAYIIPRRPRFGDRTGTDACAYAWIVWCKGHPLGGLEFLPDHGASNG